MEMRGSGRKFPSFLECAKTSVNLVNFLFSPKYALNRSKYLILRAFKPYYRVKYHIPRTITDRKFPSSLKFPSLVNFRKSKRKFPTSVNFRKLCELSPLLVNFSELSQVLYQIF